MVHAAYLNAMLAAFFTFSIRLFQRYKQANVSFGEEGRAREGGGEESGRWRCEEVQWGGEKP